MDTAPTVQPGWYPCPVTPNQLRFFDGAAWTESVAPAGRYGPPPTAPYRPGNGAPGPAYGRGPQHDAMGANPTDPMHWILPTGRSGISILAGYVGIVALFIWALGPAAVGLGVWGLTKARTGGHGSGRSIFAIIAGSIGSVLGIVYLALSLL